MFECWYRYDDMPSSEEPSPYQVFFDATTSQPNEASGATHYVTSDINNLSSYIPHVGSEHLHVGNGTNLKIFHRDYCLLPNSNGKLHLNDVLHVPNIIKNLISISKFTHDNDVI